MNNRIDVYASVYEKNKKMAADFRDTLRGQNVFCVNVMGTPGAGKTSVLTKLIKALNKNAFVIEGDVASDMDTLALRDLGIQAVQINTGGACHLDVPMVENAFGEMAFSNGFLFIENIGNLICPAEFDLGEHCKMLVASVTEGSDKPYKYPPAFEKSDVILINKWDLTGYVDFDRDFFLEGVRKLNPGAAVFTVSGKTGHGMDEIAAWLKEKACFFRFYGGITDGGPAFFYRRQDVLYKGDEALTYALDDLPGGIAVKGAGGYHLTCSPYDKEAVQGLRRLKNRYAKPFAVMFRDINTLKNICRVDEAEEQLLLSPARPIVLLKMRQNPFAENVSGAEGRCGCFLPYTPLQERLLEKQPVLIMTSANKSGSAIIKDESEIVELTRKVLYHEREIIRNTDDSVLQTVLGRPQFLRRSRGYVPLPVYMDNPKGKSLLAFGGDLKAVFGLLGDEDFMASPYYGDLENAEIVEKYEKGIEDLSELFEIKPEILVCDAHPGYISAGLAEQFARKKGLPLLRAYHHHAHIASVMAEHKLSKVLGVAFDGSGYGEDGHIWGGEFLLCEGADCRRAGHLACTKMQGGDSAAEDIKKTAACYQYALGLPSDNPHFDIIKEALAQNIHCFTTSSMGRLFDGVAAVLGVNSFNRYEGESAVLLQYLAEREASAGCAPVAMSFHPTQENGVVFDYQDIFEKCVEKPRGAALGFHRAVCEMIETMCVYARDRDNVNDIALSGGVFQNVFLLEMVIHALRLMGFTVYTNEKMPVNDGGLALGQAFIAASKGI